MGRKIVTIFGSIVVVANLGIYFIGGNSEVFASLGSRIGMVVLVASIIILWLPYGILLKLPFAIKLEGLMWGSPLAKIYSHIVGKDEAEKDYQTWLSTKK